MEFIYLGEEIPYPRGVNQEKYFDDSVGHSLGIPVDTAACKQQASRRVVVVVIGGAIE